jgi:hypothetical protein
MSAEWQFIQDPTGAVFLLWQPKTHPGVGIVADFGSFCWADLMTPEPADGGQLPSAVTKTVGMHAVVYQRKHH